MTTELLTGCSKRSSSLAAASEEAKAYSFLYVEPLSAGRTKLEAFFNILLVPFQLVGPITGKRGGEPILERPLLFLWPE